MTSVEEESSETENVSVYPNPSDGKFTLQAEANSEISVYTILGEKILSTSVGTGRINIDLKNQPNGICFLKISDGGKIQTKKILINK